MASSQDLLSSDEPASQASLLSTERLIPGAAAEMLTVFTLRACLHFLCGLLPHAGSAE